MYAWRDQLTPCHAHRIKKEDIICRYGRLRIRLWPAKPGKVKKQTALVVPVNGEPKRLYSGRALILHAGSRVTIAPGIWHEFAPQSAECIIGEVSTANDDLRDNLFLNENIGRFPGIEEDQPAAIKLLSEV
jgi:D-lyxose ketol-isomerase